MAAVSGVLSSLRPVVIVLITAAGLSMLQTALFGNQSVSMRNIQRISVMLLISAFSYCVYWNRILFLLCVCVAWPVCLFIVFLLYQIYSTIKKEIKHFA